MSTGIFFFFCRNPCGFGFDLRQQRVEISDVMHLRALSVGNVILRVIYVDDCTYCNTACRGMYSYVHVYCMEYCKLKWAMKQAILCYGSGTWPLTETAEKMLNTFERRILRRI